MNQIGKAQNIFDALKIIGAYHNLNSSTLDHKSIFNLRINKYRNFALDHSIIIPEKNLLFTWVPKCACSSLKRTLYRFKEVHKDRSFHLMDRLSRKEKIRIIRANNSLRKFALCRNPHNRILSCFLEKMTDLKFHQVQHLVNYFGQNGLDISRIKFVDFLRALDYKSNIILDSHWIPQNKFLLFPNDEYDQIFLLEHINSLIDFLTELNIEFIDDRKFKSPDGIKDMHSVSLLDDDESLNGKEMSLIDLIQAKLKNKKPLNKSFWGDEEEDIFKRIYSKDLNLINN